MTLRLAVDATPLCEARPTGVARACLGLLRAIAREPDVVVTAFAPRPVAAERLDETPVRAVVLRERGFRRALRARLDADCDFDLCWSPFIAVPVGASVPVVATFHEVPRLRDGTVEGWWRTARHASWWSVTRRVAAGAIAVSEFSASVARRRGFRGPLVVVPHGVDGIEPVLERPAGGAIVAIGTVRRKKGVELAVAAYDRLCAGRPDAPRFTWIGEGPPPRRRGGVEFVGYRDDAEVRDRLDRASCVVIPSITEGFGLPALEAMAAGCPVVVQAAGALPGVVGETGWIVDSRDPDAWAAAIGRVLDEPAAAAARARAGVERARRFTWSAAGAKAVAFFRDVAAARA